MNLSSHKKKKIIKKKYKNMKRLYQNQYLNKNDRYVDYTY